MKAKTINFKKDGDMWCATREDFINLKESLAGFGETKNKAARLLVRGEIVVSGEVIANDIIQALNVDTDGTYTEYIIEDGCICHEIDDESGDAIIVLSQLDGGAEESKNCRESIKDLLKK